MKGLKLCLGVIVENAIPGKSVGDQPNAAAPEPALGGNKDFTPAPAAPNPPTMNVEQLKAELTPAEYNSLIKPITDPIEKAEKCMQLLGQEFDKPRAKQNLTLINSFRTNIVKFYKNAVFAAKTAKKSLQKDEHKRAVEELFEKPAQAKADEISADIVKDAPVGTNPSPAQKIDPEVQATKLVMDQLNANRDAIKNDASKGDVSKRAALQVLASEYTRKLQRKTIAMTAILSKKNSFNDKQSTVSLQNFSLTGITFMMMYVPAEEVGTYKDGETVKVKYTLKEIGIGYPPECKIFIYVDDKTLAISHLAQ